MPEEKKDNPFEYQVFALSFLRQGAITYFSENLSVDVFHYSGEGLLNFYDALLFFYDKTRLDPVDPIAFKSWLENETQVSDALGGAIVVDAFIDLVCSLELSDPASVTGVLKYRWNKRKQLEQVQQLQNILSRKANLTEEESQKVALLTESIRTLEQDLEYDPLDGVSTALDIAKRVDSLFELPDFLPTQFKSLNRAMSYSEDGGFCKGAVHAILAPSGKGKSTFAKCLCNHWADSGYRVLFVNYEEAQAHWERVLFTQVVGKNIYSGNFSKEQREDMSYQFMGKMAEWGDRFMVRHDPDTPYFDDLERWLRDIIGHNDRVPDIVVIDTIQSMFTKGSVGKPRWGQFEEMMVRLEKLAKDMHAVFIITAQENSNRMKEKREVVMQSDAGGSLTIIQKCAVSIFITQNKLVTDDDSENDNIMQLQIPKNRITGSAYAGDPPLVIYDDDTKSYLDFDLPDPNLYNDPVDSLVDQLLGDGFHS